MSSLSGYNRDRNSVLADTDNYYDISQPNPLGGAGSRTYMDFPFLAEKDIEDFSQEGRVNFDFGRLTGVVGASYLQAETRQGTGGGNTALGLTSFSRVIGKTINKTYGLFFGLNYKVTSDLTVSFDGRYQNDHPHVYAPPGGTTIVADVFGTPGFYAEGALLADKSYKTFSPRVIAQYDFDRNTMAYVSFAQGVSPATFNTQFFVVPASVQRQAQADGFRLAIEPEEVDNYEIGLKGRLFGNRVRYSLAAYRALWKNQINTVTTQYIASEDGRLYSSLPSLNAGRVKMRGVEAEVSVNVFKRLSVDLNGSINDTNIRRLIAPTVTAVTGISDFSGKENPLTSKYSASTAVQYTAPLKTFDAEAYVRADYSFKSGMWSNAANLVRSPNLSLVNLRIGVTKGNASVEGFVTNLFDNHRYTSVTDTTLFTPTFSLPTAGSGLVAGLPTLRTAGLRIRYTF